MLFQVCALLSVGILKGRPFGGVVFFMVTLFKMVLMAAAYYSNLKVYSFIYPSFAGLYEQCRVRL